jgi:succinyl-diaminopimelate desuccinylase
VLLAGHLDTVPIADNVPSRREGDRLFGCGTSDMKSGDAVLLHLAATLPEPAYDLTFVLYDNEEVEAARNGLQAAGRAATATGSTPTWRAHGAHRRAGRGRAARGRCGRRSRAGSARTAPAAGWARTPSTPRAGARDARALRAREVTIDGCTYREGLNAVRIEAASPATSSRPVHVTVNFRFAPDRLEADAEALVREVLDGWDGRVTDSAPGALPGLSAPAAQHSSTPCGWRRWPSTLDRRSRASPPSAVPRAELRPGRPETSRTPARSRSRCSHRRRTVCCALPVVARPGDGRPAETAYRPQQEAGDRPAGGGT